MKTITLQLSSKALRAVALFATHDIVRYAMSGVMLELHPSSGSCGLLVATDGRRIGCCSAGITSGMLGIADSFDVIIPMSLIKCIRKTSDEISMTLDETEKLPLDDKIKRPLFRITIDDESPVQKSAIEIDGTFPKWRSVVPKEIKVPVSSTSYLNPSLLQDFCEAQSIFKKDSKSLRSMLIANSGGEESPILISFNGYTGKFFGLIMPLRGDKEDTTITIPSYVQEGAK
jgi:hypothetical protein